MSTVTPELKSLLEDLLNLALKHKTPVSGIPSDEFRLCFYAHLKKDPSLLYQFCRRYTIYAHPELESLIPF